MQRGNVKYLAVFHAWHPEVAIANEFGHSTIEAAIRVVETLCKVIFAIVETIYSAVGGVVKVWHDYFSVS